MIKQKLLEKNLEEKRNQISFDEKLYCIITLKKAYKQLHLANKRILQLEAKLRKLNLKKQ
tara:strand:+ start:54 stop:233 length:180 start_codon:yes stop_codon:yes gene_type:complete